MPIPITSPVRRFFAPEVMQTSTMDCGPAALKCLLEGFGIAVSYGRLREACQTDVDGTSIDTLEEVAMQLGLLAEQTMVPADHLLVPEAQLLPTLVVTVLPNGATHFVVVWRRHGSWLQVMDPAVGRRWLPAQRFLREVYRHTLPFDAAAWRLWAGSEGLRAPLQARLVALGLGEPDGRLLWAEAVADPTWLGLATLDAATRMGAALVRAGALRRGTEVQRLLTHLCQRAAPEPPDRLTAIPAAFWAVQPLAETPSLAATPAARLLLHGGVLVRVTGRRVVPPPTGTTRDTGSGASRWSEPPLAPDLVAALAEAPAQPVLAMLRFLREDGLLTPTVVLLALLLASVGVAGEAVLLQGLLGLSRLLSLTGPPRVLLGAIGLLTLLLLGVEWPMASMVSRLGRRLETRFRLAFLAKLPHLGDRYFHSRLTSDMAQRAHTLRQLRLLPPLGVRFLRLGCQLCFTAAGLIWLVPSSALIVLLTLLGVGGMACVAQPLLRERDMRVRTQLSALSRFYLDALLGLVPVHTHGAARALRREHDSQLVEWVRASGAFARVDAAVQATMALMGLGGALWILQQSWQGGGTARGLLLVLYWSLNLPLLAQMLADLAKQYPMQRNSVLRLLEPLSAPSEDDLTAPAATPPHGAQPAVPPAPAHRGVAIALHDVTVRAGGHTILHDITLQLQPGEHLALVGASGAGKSSLVGLLLGWHRPAQGQILVDGVPLLGAHLAALRRVTAWVDPAVHVWNRSLLDNLRYGVYDTPDTTLDMLLAQTELLGVLERLPQGLQTRLGEGGRLVSGGEGQRVRLGRALWRPGVRLVILDEPFRGLERAQRRQLLATARQVWHGVTLVCITHDVSETQDFPRVVVMAEGHIVEDASPEALTAQPESRYQTLLEADIAVRQVIWEQTAWRRVWLDEGRLRERT